MKLPSSSLVLSLAAAACLSFLPAAAGAGAPSQASVLVGKPVVDGAGTALGNVTDLLVDLDQARLDAVVVDGRAIAAGKLELREGALVVDGPTGSTDAPAAGARSFKGIVDATLRDKEGHTAGNVADLMVRLDDARIASMVIRFDPKWLEMEALAAVPLSSVERSGDGFVAKFRSADVRPAPAAQRGSARAAAPPPAPPAVRARLSRVAHAPVIDQAGHTIGKVEDALVDVDARRIAALAVRSGSRRLHLAFPQAGLRFEGGKVIAAAPLDSLEKAGSARLSGANRILDTRIHDAGEHEVGRLEDVVADMGTGKLTFAVARFTPDWVAPEWRVALPLRAAREGEGGALSMRFDLHDVNNAYVFQEKQWPDISSAAVRAAIHARIDRL
jgi:sporulation protein YlmC with PRC-barrel domain